LVSRSGEQLLSARIEEWQLKIADRLREIVNRKPIEVRLRGKLAKTVIGEVLNQADKRRLTFSIAQYLVGAKLLMRFPDKRDLITVAGANLADRSSAPDRPTRRGDFDLGSHVFEVTVGPPDSKHFDQVQSILSDSDAFVWLLVREDRWTFWCDEAQRRRLDMRRVVIAPIELFVGQNVSEMGVLSDGEIGQLRRLFDEYNRTWIDQCGTNGMRVDVK
jgi:hypothetical protein